MKNKLPKVEFVCSWIYYDNWKKWASADPILKGKSYPAWKDVLKFLKRIEPRWRKLERKILGELSKATNLKWNSGNIKCYLVGRCIPFSDPLTMHVSYKSDEEFMDVLTHELIHQILFQNYDKTQKMWSYVDKKYKKESFTTRIHILIHALHQHIFLKFFDEKRLNDEIRWAQKLPDYKRSWQIVEEEGYENIIKALVSRVKR